MDLQIIFQEFTMKQRNMQIIINEKGLLHVTKLSDNLSHNCLTICHVTKKVRSEELRSEKLSGRIDRSSGIIYAW